MSLKCTYDHQPICLSKPLNGLQNYNLSSIPSYDPSSLCSLHLSSLLPKLSAPTKQTLKHAVISCLHSLALTISSSQKSLPFCEDVANLPSLQGLSRMKSCVMLHLELGRICRPRSQRMKVGMAIHTIPYHCNLGNLCLSSS